MQNDPLVGTQLGAYLIQAKIGEGGMARVYKAYHARLRREVAIKVILPQVADKSGFTARFEQEAQLVASLEHRNIVAVYDFGETDKLTYLVMQYVGGGTLRDQMRKQGRIEPRQATQYAIQIAHALHHAHQRGIVHRDVKPQNMLISGTDSNYVLLSDFGIAKMFDSTREETIITSAGVLPNRSEAGLTNVGQMVGTAEYMAPEQINRQPVDARTDVYALGIVLFQMLTAEIPFSSTTVDGLLFQHVYTPPRSAREVNPNVPQPLEHIINQALSKSPAQRYQSAEAMAQALEAWLNQASSTLVIDRYGTHGLPSGDAVTYPSQPPSIAPRPSFYGPGQTPPPQNTPPGQQSHYSNYGTIPSLANPNQPSLPGTGAGISMTPPPVAVPVKPRARPGLRLSTIMMIVIGIIGIVLLVTRYVPLSTFFGGGTPGGGGNTCFQAASFTDQFQNNNCSWSGNQGGLTAIVNSNTYTLSVSDNNTYFPHPAPDGDTNGPLPQNFTVTAQMEQNQGTGSEYYGIAFRLRGFDTGSVYSYAFLINKAGSYQFVKYSGGAKSIERSGGPFSAITNVRNILEVNTQGNTFSFKVNNVAVPINGPNVANQSFTDTNQPLTGGQFALVVTGPNTIFAATYVTLTKS